MIRFLLRLSYDLTVFPLRLALWGLRRLLSRRPEGFVKLHLKAMPQAGHSSLFNRRETLEDFQRQMDHAATDPAVTGLFVVFEAFHVGLVDSFELRDVFERVKTAGKPVHVHLAQADNRSMAAAAAADRLSVSPAGSVMVHGLGNDVPFFGDFLHRFGIGLQVVQRKEYKTAMEPFARAEPTAEFLESTNAMYDSLTREVTQALSARPSWDPARAAKAIDEGPYTMAQAVGVGLIDAATEPQEAEHVAAEAGGGPSPTRHKVRTRGTKRPPRPAPEKGALPPPSLKRLRDVRTSGSTRPRAIPLRKRPQIAFVPVVGMILDWPVTGLGRGASAAASQLEPAILRVADARGIEAIVLMIDSRGGTATASDRIWSAARYALSKKPVIAWMRGYAASGGSYVAAAAQHIIASSVTITGSIGVVASKPNIAEAARRLDINAVLVGRGAGISLLSPFRPFGDHELDWLNASLDEFYARFKSVVAEGRRMPLDRVEELARGRVWTGRDAADNGLVDEIGNYRSVIAKARALAGIPDGRDHETAWAALPEGPARILRRIIDPGASDIARIMSVAGIDRLVEMLTLAEQAPVLYVLP